MKLKNIICISILLLAISSILAACSKETISKPERSDTTALGTTSVSISSTPEQTDGPHLEDYAGHTFRIRYLDVGQADAALVECDGHYMLIDGGNVADSSLIFTVLKSEGVTHLDYIVNTHPHEDHVGGLSGALNVCTVDHVFCPATVYDSKAFDNFLKYTEMQNKTIEIPVPGDSYELGVCTFKILGPVTSYDSTNNISIVLRIEYGDTSFLFTGDMERDAETDLLDFWGDAEVKSTVLKVGHHGSDTSSSYHFLWAVEPTYAVISVGQGNTYGHPTENVLSRLRDADVKVYRTDQQGDIICTSDGSNVTFIVERNQDIDTLSTAGSDNTQQGKETVEDHAQGIPEDVTYVLNANTLKFHDPTCSSVTDMSEKNRIYFTGTRDEALANGYDACGRCRP